MAGFRYAKRQGASDTCGTVQTFAVDANHADIIAQGDVVLLDTDGSDAVTGVALVDTETAVAVNQLGVITGIISFVDFQLAGENLTELGLPALTAGTVKCYIDNSALFEVEVNATLGASQVGLNAAYDATAATKTGGLTLSNMLLDNTTTAPAATSTFPFRIVALLPGIDTGILGDRAVVRMNNTTQIPGATGV